MTLKWMLRDESDELEKIHGETQGRIQDTVSGKTLRLYQLNEMIDQSNITLLLVDWGIMLGTI